jgi:hypothetical protein
MLQRKAMQKQASIQYLHMMMLILLAILLVIPLITCYKILVQDTFAISSPSFQRQELILGSGNLLNMFNENSTVTGLKHIDIESVSYFSNGTDINATLWLANFTISPPGHENVNYGMYFDADSNNRTGSGGVDYKVEISWNNESQTWTRVFEEWSSSGKNKTLDKKVNFTDFFRKGGSYVTLSADLDSMLSPENYRILFYAEAINFFKALDWIIDSTDWMSIPPPELDFVVSPSPIVLTQGGNSIVELRINSSSADELDIDLGLPMVYGTNTTGITIALDSKKLHIPPFAVASIPLRVSVPFGAVSTQYTITIPATITPVHRPLQAGFGPAERPPSENESLNSELGGPDPSQRVSKRSDEALSKVAVFSVQVMTINEQLNILVNQWITPLTAIYTSISSIVGGILVWIYGRRRRRQQKRKN